MLKFVARQPIFDSKENIYGYELLFRSGLENYFKCDNPDQATSNVIVDSFLLFGIKTLTSGHHAFLNFTDDLLLKKFATLLPNQQVVIEILETVDPSPELVSACKDLKDQGYRLALDDFEYRPELDPLIEMVDLIKIDIQKTPLQECDDVIKKISGRGIPLLAEKIETLDQFKTAQKLGFSYFQGYFFGRPETFSTLELHGFKLNYLQLVREINEKNPDIKRIEEIIQQEPMISYNLFRYINSPGLASNREIRSIRQALAVLGLNEVRKWISIVSLASMGADKPSALMTAVIVRAKFCETLAPMIGRQHQSIDLFLMGLLSMIDTILEKPLPEILEQVVVSDTVKFALLENKGPLKPVLDLVLATEKESHPEIAQISASMKISEEALKEAYLGAIAWGNEILQFEKETRFQETTTLL